MSDSSKIDHLTQALMNPHTTNQLPLLASFLDSWIPNIVFWSPWILKGSKVRIPGPTETNEEAINPGYSPSARRTASSGEAPSIASSKSCRR